MTHEDAVIKEPGVCVTCGKRTKSLQHGYCRQCIETLGKKPEADPTEMARQELVHRELCRRRLLPFVQRLVPQYRAGWFHIDLAARLERFVRRVEAGESPRLLLSTPPRHGKSELASKSMLAWYLGRNPGGNVISATHSDRLAMDNSRDVLDYVKNPDFQSVFPGFSLNRDSKGAMGWRTEQGGMYKPVGVGAGISGYGAHILAVDDAHRDKDAYSPTIRDNVWRWYRSSAATRLLPGGGVLGIGTRWVMDDIIGRLIETDGLVEEGGEWEYVRYPAVAEKDEYRLPSGRIIHWAHPRAEKLRSAGEALDPNRYPISELKKQPAWEDPATWAATFQQNPTAGDAAQFSEEHFDTCACRMADIPERLAYYTTWDLALGTKDIHDPSAALTGGIDSEGVLWLVDVQRERFGPDAIVERIIDHYLEWRQDIVGIEKTQYAVGLATSLQTALDERSIYGFPHQDLEHGNKDKVTRVQPFRQRMARGMVRIPVDAPWYEQFKKELLEFPGGRHDDLVDCAAYLAQLLEDMIEPAQPRSTAEASWRDKVRKHQRRNRSWKVA